MKLTRLSDHYTQLYLYSNVFCRYAQLFSVRYAPELLELDVGKLLVDVLGFQNFLDRKSRTEAGDHEIGQQQSLHSRTWNPQRRQKLCMVQRFKKYGV